MYENDEPSPGHDNVTVLHRLQQEVWNEGRFEALDEVMAPDVVVHMPTAEIRGKQEFKSKQLDLFSEAFSDMHLEIEETLASGERVAARWRVSMRHTGGFQGIPPTGRELTMTGQSVFHFRDGRIVEAWDEWNLVHLLTQLGALPEPVPEPTDFTIGEDLLRTVEEASESLLAFSEEESARRPAPGRWSPKEVVGHLVDSASNNHVRFVEAQFRDGLVFPGYEQRAWVAAQRYQETSWASLVELWRDLNRHLARVIDAVPADVRERPRQRHNLDQIAWRTVPKDKEVTLGYFMADYLLHLKHHLGQILTPAS